MFIRLFVFSESPTPGNPGQLPGDHEHLAGLRGRPLGQGPKRQLKPPHRHSFEVYGGPTDSPLARTEEGGHQQTQ